MSGHLVSAETWQLFLLILNLQDGMQMSLVFEIKFGEGISLTIVLDHLFLLRVSPVALYCSLDLLHSFFLRWICLPPRRESLLGAGSWSVASEALVLLPDVRDPPKMECS